MTPTVIDDFSGEYGFLSNFDKTPFYTFEYGEVPTNEHLYQMLKTPDKEVQQWILSAPSPGKAKRWGNSQRMTKVMHPDWEARKLHVMRYGLTLKFTYNTDLANRLLDTGDAMLIEGNDWDDTFWGVCNGEGDNWLGYLLMARRAELRAANPRLF